MKVSIYSLNCPYSNEIMYIGKSINLEKRYHTHITSPNNSLSQWIEKLKSKNKKPIMNELFICKSEEEAFRVEKEYILKHRNNGKLLNIMHNCAIKKSPYINYLKK